MRDYTKNILLPEPKLAKIKGHTRIELTKVATGEKRIIEHDNIFQSNVVARQLRALGAANNNPFADNTWRGLPIYRNLCGGVFLFRDQIDTTGGDVEYMPAGNLMVANGSFAQTNNGAPQELGSFNSIESSFSGNSAVFVYDWGTSQGNGTINCVCLTGETGGWIGYGNASGDAATPRNLNAAQSAIAISDAQWFYNGNKYKFSAFDTATNKAKIRKGIDGVTKISLFYGIDGTEKEYTVTGSPFATGNAFLAAKQVAPTKVVLIPSNNRNLAIANGSTANLMIYDCETDTISLQPIINTSGESVDVLTYGNNTQCSCTILGIDAAGKIYFDPQYNKDGFIFNADGTLASRISSRGSNSGSGTQIAPGLFLHIPQTTAQPLVMVDSVSGTARPTNGGFPTATGVQTFSMMYGIDALAFLATDVSSAPTLYKNPLFLATVNNLDSPVTKDSTQTMKVIYTLTEASA